MLTASRLELAERCPGHLTVPHVQESTEWSEGGTERHARDEEAIGSGNVPEIYTERWPGLTWRAEVRYVYDVSSDSSEFCGIGSTRDYGPPGPFRIGGTVDVEGRDDHTLVIVDKKSFEVVTVAERNPQVRFLALAAARYRPAKRIFVGINHELTGLDVAELDPLFDLDLIARHNRQLLIRSAEIRGSARAGVPAPFRTGRWCRWCPGFAACPVQAELRDLVRSDDEVAVASSIADAADASTVYEFWKRLGILHKRIGQQLHSYAAVHPIRLDSGKVFGRRVVLGNEKLNGDVVYQIVKEEHGQEMADAVVTRNATKKRLEEVLKRAGARKVLNAVRAAGGATRKETTTIEEYDATPRLVAGVDDGGDNGSPF